MIRVVMKNQEIELTLAQVVEAIKQLKPEEKTLVRSALDERAWSSRVDDLLARVWTRVEQLPLADEEIHAEIESVRQALFDASGH